MKKRNQIIRYFIIYLIPLLGIILGTLFFSVLFIYVLDADYEEWKGNRAVEFLFHLCQILFAIILTVFVAKKILYYQFKRSLKIFSFHPQSILKYGIVFVSILFFTDLILSILTGMPLKIEGSFEWDYGILIGVIVLIVVSTYEEYLFRAFLLDAVERKVKSGILSSGIIGFLFTIYHTHRLLLSETFLYSFLVFFLSSSLMTYVMIRTKKIEITIGMHIFRNYYAWFILGSGADTFLHIDKRTSDYDLLTTIIAYSLFFLFLKRQKVLSNRKTSYNISYE
ncbi:CAAX protease self-immunity [Marivirga sericea]|uniref:CAAX protease self-immunity n=1 Tax=Marivirga sericea TaxID=1028 RepID=A0A1X7LIY0_9BACT|nr:type II CAAX endopeptidase family protein [Marivirga sericea]SMG53848.1 CAAX protease self-immunity [Marivirga sericea]